MTRHRLEMLLAVLPFAWALAGCGGSNNTFNPTTVVSEGEGDFLIAVSPGKHKALSEMAGTGMESDPFTYLVTVRSQGGFASPVKLSLQYDGPGTIPIIAWTSAEVTPTPSGAQTTLRLGNGYDDKIPVGIYPLQITGVGGGLTRKVSASLVITGYDMTIAPPSQYLPAEGSVDFALTFVPLPPSDSFTGTIEIGSLGAPPGVAPSVDPTVVTFAEGAGPQTATLTVRWTAAPIFAAYQVYVTTSSMNRYFVNKDAEVTFTNP